MIYIKKSIDFKRKIKVDEFIIIFLENKQINVFIEYLDLQYRLRTSNDDFEEKLLELKQQLGRSEQRNDYLTNKLSELNQIIASTKTEQFDSDESSQIDSDSQQFTDRNNEKDKQYLQEVQYLLSFTIDEQIQSFFLKDSKATFSYIRAYQYRTIVKFITNNSS